MVKSTRKIKTPYPYPIFTAETDKPLRYFLIKDVFVRLTPDGNYKLICGKFHVLTLDRNGWLYLYPSCTKHHTQYVEAFLHDYAPHTDISRLTPYVGCMHWVYIGNPQFAEL